MPIFEDVDGMPNPQRALWGGTLMDIGNFIAGAGQVPFQGLGPKMMMQQQRLNQQAARSKWKYLKSGSDIIRIDPATGETSIIHEGPETNELTAIQKEAAAMFPGDKPAQDKFIQAYRAKSGVSVNVGKTLTESFVDQLPDAFAAARDAQANISRIDQMKDLVPQLGKTGTGKEAITNLRSFMSAVGGDHIAGFIDTLSEAAGIDIMSGDLEATQLFRALGATDVISKARELYPVSDNDINLLKQGMASLQQGPETMNRLLDRQRVKSQTDIEYYDAVRTTIGPEAEQFPKIEYGQYVPQVTVGTDTSPAGPAPLKVGEKPKPGTRGIPPNATVMERPNGGFVWMVPGGEPVTWEE